MSDNPSVSLPASDTSQRRVELRSSIDDIIDLYKKDVDRTMLRENLKLSVTERFARFELMARQFVEIHEAGRRHRGEA